MSSAEAGFVRTVRGEHAVTLLLDRPPVNVLSGAVMRELTHALRLAGADPDVKLVVLRGAGRCFSAGADVGEHLPPDVGPMLATLRALLVALDDVPVPTLAALHGATLGGGLELALAADRRIAAADARLGNPEVKLKVMAPAAAVLLPDLVGPAEALRLLTTGVDVGADEAWRMGLVDRVVALAEFDAVLEAERAALAELSRAALVATKRALRVARRGPSLDERLAATERLYLAEVAESPEAVAALRAFISRSKR